jgi:hypothetical protein
MTPVRLFLGFDPREAIGFHVFVHSLLERASVPVSIVPLASMGLGYGSNAFTVSRFLVPYLCGFEGHAIFLDGSDMLMQEDIAELDKLFDPKYALQCVKHDYKTRHKRKYVGTPMESVNIDYRLKNAASVIIWNCEHPDCRIYPDDIKGIAPLHLLQFDFTDAECVGDLPAKWNVLADEGQSLDDAKILHMTAGLPCFNEYRNTPGAEKWWMEYALMNEAKQFEP